MLSKEDCEEEIKRSKQAKKDIEGIQEKSKVGLEKNEIVLKAFEDALKSIS